MTDARRRRLERDTSPAARALVLVERLRSGELTLEHVACAASLGHEAAQRALHVSGHQVKLQPLFTVAAGLELLGAVSAVRFGGELVKAAIVAHLPEGLGRRRAEVLVAAAMAWADCPNDETAWKAHEAFRLDLTLDDSQAAATLPRAARSTLQAAAMLSRSMLLKWLLTSRVARAVGLLAACGSGQGHEQLLAERLLACHAGQAQDVSGQ